VERGPHGTVFRAREVGSDRAVLVRLLPEGFAVSSAAFVSAARLASTLVHPHIAAVYDAGEYRGRSYVALQDVGGMPVTDAALALEHARGRRFVHTDLRPGCLRVSRGGNGRVFVTGLGLGRPPENWRPDSWSASPEEREGRRPDARSNVYSLGAILYALAAGAPPPSENPPRPVADRGLADTILKALARDPESRPASAGSFAEALTRWLDGEASTRKLREDSGEAGTPPAPRRTSDAPSRRRGIVVAAAVAVTLLGVGWVVLRPKETVRDAPRVAEASPAEEPKPLPPAPPPPPPEIVIKVDSAPGGARVFLDGTFLGFAPVIVPREGLVRVELDGHTPWEEKVVAGGPSRTLNAVLKPLPARVHVEGAPPRTTFRLFTVPEGVRNPKAALALWSDEPEELRRGLDALDEGDAGYARERLRTLAEQGPPALRERARSLARAPAAPFAIRVETSAESDDRGIADLGDVRAAASLRAHGTAGGRRDFCSEPLRIESGKKLTVRAVLFPIPPPPPAPVLTAAPPKPKPEPKPQPPKPEPPKPPPPREPENVGTVEGVSLVGTIVRLEPGARVAVKDVLQAWKEGQVVAELVVDYVLKPDDVFAHGSLSCRATSGQASKGNLIRRKK